MSGSKLFNCYLYQALSSQNDPAVRPLVFWVFFELL